MRGWKIVFVVGGVLVVAWAALFLNQKPEERTPIRIGTNPWPGYEFLHLADQKSFFREEGANIQLVRFDTLEDTRRAFERGQIDGMTVTMIELLQANEDGSPSRVAAFTDFSNGPDVILARGGIKSVADLKGRTVGIEPSSLSVFIIARALEKAGLSLDDVKIRGVNPTNMEEAMKSGEVDAVHTYPPLSLEMQKRIPGLTKIFDSSQIPGEILAVIAFNPDIVAHRKEDLRAMRRAWDKTLAYADAHPDEANTIMAKMENISPQEFAQARSEIKLLPISEQNKIMAPGGSFEQTLTKVQALLHKQGQIKQDHINAGDYLVRLDGEHP